MVPCGRHQHCGDAGVFHLLQQRPYKAEATMNRSTREGMESSVCGMRELIELKDVTDSGPGPPYVERTYLACGHGCVNVSLYIGHLAFDILTLDM